MSAEYDDAVERHDADDKDSSEEQTGQMQAGEDESDTSDELSAADEGYA